MMNYIKSIIKFPFGHITESNIMTNLSKNITLTILDKNSIELKFEYSSSCDKSWAMKNAESESRIIANSISLKNKVYNIVSPCSKTHWQTENEGVTRNTISKGMSYEISTSFEVLASVETIIDKDTMIFEGLEDSLDCYNNALMRFSADKDDTSSTAIWLRNCWETLQIETKSKSVADFKKHITDHILDRRTTELLGFSIGKYYVHKKDVPPKIPLPIGDCIDKMQTILLHFANTAI